VTLRTATPASSSTTTQPVSCVTLGRLRAKTIMGSRHHFEKVHDTSAVDGYLDTQTIVDEYEGDPVIALASCPSLRNRPGLQAGHIGSHEPDPAMAAS
jgi:hypothetical protein